MHKPQELSAKIVLGVAAHPDDLDFAAGGTVAKLVGQGAEVYYLILTDGRRGSEDPQQDAAALTEQRQQEQQAACKALGVTKVFFLNFEDGALQNTAEVRKEIVRVIRKLQPDTVITLDPSMLYATQFGFINHPDHRAAGQATLDAVYPLARNAPSFPELMTEGLEPHKVKTMLLANFNQHTSCIDITQTIDQKVEAIAAHTSQIGGIDAVRPVLDKMNKAAGQEINCAYGETFVRIDITD